jgi:cadmium resistance protein CadD (predicted permease)
MISIKVLLVTLANSGDNIIVYLYLPLFAAASTAQIFELIIIFYVLLVLWI